MEVGGLIVELSSDVDVCGSGSHGPAGNKTPFQKLVRVVPHDLTILACSRLTLLKIKIYIFSVEPIEITLPQNMDLK